MFSTAAKTLTKFKYGAAVNESQSVWARNGRFNQLYNALGINKKVIKYTYLKNGGDNFLKSNIERQSVVTIKKVPSGVQAYERELHI